MNNSNVLNNFAKYLESNNYAKTTINIYKNDLIEFFLFLKEYMDIDFTIEKFNIFILLKVKQADIIAFLVYLNVKKHNGSATRQRKLASIKRFYKWLVLSHPKYENPVKNYWIETTERLPKVLNLKQAKMMQNVFNSNNHRHYIRDNLIINVFLITGIRLSELTNIKIKHINFKSSTIKIIAKGNKERLIYMPISLKQQILEYCKNRNEEDYLFSNNEKKMSNKNVQCIIKKAYNLLKIGDRGYSVHTLRHTSATILYENTKDILLVKEFLGHNSVLSTQIYSHVSNDLVKNAVNNNPLNFL